MHRTRSGLTWNAHPIGAPPEKRPRIADDADRADVATMAKALHLLGVVRTPEDLVASWRPEGGSAVRGWPDAEPDAAQAAIYAVRPTTRFVVKVRSPPVASIARSGTVVRTLSQTDVAFHGCVAYCETVDQARETLAASPDADVLVIRGEASMLIFAASIAPVFTRAYYIDRVCRKQLLVGQRPIVDPDPTAVAHARKQYVELPDFMPGVEWPAAKAWVHDMPLASKPQDPEEPAEVKAVRKSLSDAHKDFARRGLDELLWNHLSAKVGDGWMITPGDRFWSHVEPETLVRSSANVTADVLHTAVFSATDMTTIVHTHSPAIEAVSCLAEGFVPPPNSEFVGKVAYHPWEGISDDPNEGPRLGAAIKAVPGCHTLIARNHGAFTFGKTVEEAVERHLALDAACREQILGGGGANLAHDELRRDPLWRNHRPWVVGGL